MLGQDQARWSVAILTAASNRYWDEVVELAEQADGRDVQHLVGLALGGVEYRARKLGISTEEALSQLGMRAATMDQ